PQLPGKLALANVHREHAGRAVLQQAIGKAAGGGAQIQSGEPAHLDLEMAEGVFQFSPAAADVFFAGAQGHFVVRTHRIAGLVRRLLIDLDLASHDGALGLLAALAQALFDKGDVQTLHLRRFLSRVRRRGEAKSQRAYSSVDRSQATWFWISRK